jgi:enoyl-[acyl-carrier-protein] reductase (NADH)
LDVLASVKALEVQDDAGMVAAVTAFLASDDASYITGQTIYPDGGRLVLNYTVPVAWRRCRDRRRRIDGQA